MHPAIFDAAVHIAVHPCLTGNMDLELYHLPSKFRAVRLCPGYFDRPFPKTVYSYAKFIDWTPGMYLSRYPSFHCRLSGVPGTMVYDFKITDGTGNILCVLEGMEVSLHGYRMKTLERRFDEVYRPTKISLAWCKEDNVNSNAIGGTDGQPKGNANSSLYSSSLIAHANKAATPDIVIVPYVRGDEMTIHACLTKLDPLQTLTILFVADFGVSGDAAKGFTRALRKEHPAWTIRLVAFDDTWSSWQRAEALQALVELYPKELDLRVDANGTVFSPRLELMDPPRQTNTFSVYKPWKVENGHVLQTSLPLQQVDNVIVHVSKYGPSRSGIWSFVGAVEGVPHQVIGVSSSPVSSHVLVHKGCVVEVDQQTFRNTIGPPILALTLVALAVGPLAVSSSIRLAGKLVLIVEEDPTLRAQLGVVCVSLGLVVVTLSALSPADLESLYDKNPQFILSGAQDPATITIMYTLVAPGGRLFPWNSPEEGLASIIRNRPWDLGDALRCVIGWNNELADTYSHPSAILEIYPQVVSGAADLFDPEKAYLLVGGIGRLGSHMALWMYKVR